MVQKFESIDSQLVNIKYDLIKNMEDIVNESLSKVKDAMNNWSTKGKKIEASAKSQIIREQNL